MGVRKFLGLKPPYSEQQRNVFVLCSGRCGSQTFAAACRHIKNYSSGHETRSRLVGEERLSYPVRHIEVDNRLSWLLGRLDRKYGQAAFYVHLTRAPDLVSASFVRRATQGLAKAYREGIVMGAPGADPAAVAGDLVDTVTTNVRLFLRDKPHQMDFRLETAREDFSNFWAWVGAEGDLTGALAEFEVRHDSHQVVNVAAAPSNASMRAS